jgi:hypothetical protein
MHENQMSSKRNSRTCFKCSKTRHFFVECPKLNDNNKHKSKDKRRRYKKKDHGHGRKVWSREKMNKSSNVESDSEDTSSRLSDEEEEGGKTKKKKTLSKKFNSLCVMGLSSKDGFCNMAHSSSSKRRQKDTSNSDSEDEICMSSLPCARRMRSWLTCLITVITCLERPTKLRNVLRASLEDARNIVELETQNLEAKLEIDSHKANHVVSNEVDCGDCVVFLADLIALKENHASKCEELDVLRVEGSDGD